jgi:hypothetical protein
MHSRERGTLDGLGRHDGQTAGQTEGQEENWLIWREREEREGA